MLCSATVGRGGVATCVVEVCLGPAEVDGILDDVVGSQRDGLARTRTGGRRRHRLTAMTPRCSGF